MAVSQKLTLYQGAQDIAGNTSTLRIFWTSTQTGQSYNNNTKTAKYWVSVNDGPEQEYAISYKLPKGKTQTIADVTIDVPHDDYGNCTIAVRTWMDTGISAGVVQNSASIDLTPIPRANTITAGDAYIGGTMHVTVARKSASYLHSIKYVFGGLSGYLTTDGFSALEAKTAITDYALSIPNSWDAEVRDSKTSPIIFTCTTYLGTEKIGESTAEATIKTDGTFAPQVYPSVVDVNEAAIALTGNASQLIRGVSTARATIEATPLRGATIKSTEINGVQTEALEVEAVQTGTFVFSATDSRGWETTQAMNLGIIPYIPLSAVIETERGAQGSNALTVIIKGNYYSGSFGAESNTLTVQIKADDGAWQTVEATIEGNTYTAQVDMELDYQTAHALYFRIADAVTTLTLQQYIPRAVPQTMEGEGWIRHNVPVIQRLNYDNYVGRGDTDETGLEAWLDGLMADMPTYSRRGIMFVCSAVTGYTICAELYKHDSSYASVMGHSYDGYTYHKTKYNGVWNATAKG